LMRQQANREPDFGVSMPAALPPSCEIWCFVTNAEMKKEKPLGWRGS
jgi:hypothetical protein